MSESQLPDKSFINSIIGEGTRFKGEFDLNGLLRIDGDFSGTVRTNGKVLVGSNGRAECTIYAGTIVVGGIVKGNIYASEKVIILSTGMMLGNISTPRLIIEEGVIFNGNCKIEKTNEGEPVIQENEEPLSETKNLKPLYEEPKIINNAHKEKSYSGSEKTGTSH